ncbi:uncharacterized protein LOC131318004 isoform X2 [Rhododendron vialii]|uniref:uncharacterized protein LOC131318004 isoform X2 n=1 Tax=Rhododendron vialii TaxID=182163 RepID=UPI00265E6F36|nr:uncharacterized protein LOC131318004 isoform X2 [Rhododendron vialii]
MRYRKESNDNQSPRVLGFHQSSDNFTATIIYYHKALWLKPDDQFCTEMLTLALVDECRHGVEPKRIPVKTIYLYIENMKITANVVFYVANI